MPHDTQGYQPTSNEPERLERVDLGELPLLEDITPTKEDALIARLVRAVERIHEGVKEAGEYFRRENALKRLWSPLLGALGVKTDPKRHREVYRIARDGDPWCAVPGGFVNLQESPAGFGPTPLEALKELLDVQEKAAAPREGPEGEPAARRPEPPRTIPPQH